MIPRGPTLQTLKVWGSHTLRGRWVWAKPIGAILGNQKFSFIIYDIYNTIIIKSRVFILLLLSICETLTKYERKKINNQQSFLKQTNNFSFFQLTTATLSKGLFSPAYFQFSSVQFSSNKFSSVQFSSTPISSV